MKSRSARAKTEPRGIPAGRIVAALELWAPPHLALEWDNSGLQVGDPSAEVKKILIALDPTHEVIQHAVKHDCEMIVCHHPLIFSSIKRLRADSSIGRALATLLSHKILLYAAHTNLDAAPGGVNDVLAKTLELNRVRPLRVVARQKLFKLAVFVPEKNLNEVREAMCRAGAGVIGNYSFCTFRTAGTGSFFPEENASPSVGKVGQLEEVPEMRLEILCRDSVLENVLNAMREAHPYEEVAYDVYPLENRGAEYSLGCYGELSDPVEEADFVEYVKWNLDIKKVRVAGRCQGKIKRVAVCGGAGADLIRNAKSAKCDALVTGDVKYHEALLAAEENILLIDAGHFATERVVLPAIGKKISEKYPRLHLEIFPAADAFRFC